MREATLKTRRVRQRSPRMCALCFAGPMRWTERPVQSKVNDYSCVSEPSWVTVVSCSIVECPSKWARNKQTRKDGANQRQHRARYSAPTSSVNHDVHCLAALRSAPIEILPPSETVRYIDWMKIVSLNYKNVVHNSTNTLCDHFLFLSTVILYFSGTAYSQPFHWYEKTSGLCLIPFLTYQHFDCAAASTEMSALLVVDSIHPPFFSLIQMTWEVCTPVFRWLTADNLLYLFFLVICRCEAWLFFAVNWNLWSYQQHPVHSIYSLCIYACKQSSRKTVFI